MGVERQVRVTAKDVLWMHETKRHRFNDEMIVGA